MPQANAYRADGTPIAPEELPAAIASGEAGFRASDKVLMTDQYGVAHEVSGAEVGARMGDGFSVMSGEGAAMLEAKKAAETTGGMIRTGAEGIARGVTMGLSDAAAGYVDPELAASMGERAEFNPGVAMGGEILGAAGTAIATGGTGALGRAAAFTPAGAAARLGTAAEGLVGRSLGGLAARGAGGNALAGAAKMGASGLIEGGAYGMGSAAGQAALQNEQLTAEKLLVGGLEGMALGGAGGAVMGGAGGLIAGKLGGKVAGKADDIAADVSSAAGKGERGLLAQTADDLANRQTFKSLGLQGSDTAKLEMKLGRDKMAGVARRLHEEDLISAADDLPTRAAKLEARANKAGDEIGSVIKRVDAEGGAMPTGLSVMQRVRSEVLDKQFAGDALTRAANKDIIRKIEAKVLGPLAKMDQAGGASLESLWKFRRQIDEMGKFGKEFSALSGGEEAMRATRKVIEDEIEKTIAHHSTDLAQTYKTAKDDYTAFGDLSKMTTKRAGMEEGNRFLSLSDNLMMAGGLGGAIASGDPETAVGAAGLGLLNRFARTRGTVAAAKIARKLADVNVRKTTAIRAIVDDAAPKPTIRKGSPKLAGGDMAARAARIGLLAADDPGSPVSVETQGEPPQDFPSLLSSVQQAATDPQGYAERIGEQLGDLARDEPNLADAIIQKSMADAAYLNEHAPQGYNRADGGSITPLAEVSTIPRHQVESFMRRVQALNDPLSVAEAIANGDLPLEGIHALKMRRPEMYQEIRTDIIEATTQRDKPLPYTKRVTLGVAFEFQSDRSLDPAYVDRIQQDYAAQAKAVQEKKQPPPPKGRPDSGAIMTPAQKLAMGA